MKPSLRQAAFSLVELVVVMLVMGILAGVAAPRYVDAIDHARVDAAARRVAADLRYARAEALRASSDRSVQFTVADDTYRLAGVADPDHPASDYEVDLSEGPYGVELVSVDFGGGDTASYSVYGTPSASGFVRLQAGDHRIEVVCDAAGGSSYAPW